MEEGELEDGEERARELEAEAEEEEHIAALQRALSLPDLLTAPLVIAEADASPVVAAGETGGGPTSVNLWPRVLEEVDSTAVPDWPDLSSGGPEVEAWMRRHQQVLVRAVTWNLAGNKPPAAEETLGRLFPTNRYHVCVVGTEECERSIAASALNPSKRLWEEYLCTVMGKQYVPLRSHTLQAIHAMVFVHVGIAHLCSDITSAAVATGIANTLGNKGGVAISMRIAGTKFVFANAHLAAHQNAVKQRNAEYAKLCRELPLLLAKKEKTPLAPPPTTTPSSAPSSSSSSSSSAEAAPQTDTNFKTPSPAPTPGPAGPDFESCADRVVFMGDLNYRVRGNRQAVDTLLQLGMHDVLLANDQLRWSMQQGLVLGSFVEPPLNFRPTYKFDFDSDVYDSSAKQRIPAWADRILYVPRGLECLAYNSDISLRTSDHRPVYATFVARVDCEQERAPTTPTQRPAPPLPAAPAFTSESQVCSVQ